MSVTLLYLERSDILILVTITSQFLILKISSRGVGLKLTLPKIDYLSFLLFITLMHASFSLEKEIRAFAV
jgi:hypothetical protein